MVSDDPQQVEDGAPDCVTEQVHQQIVIAHFGSPSRWSSAASERSLETGHQPIRGRPWLLSKYESQRRTVQPSLLPCTS